MQKWQATLIGHRALPRGANDRAMEKFRAQHACKDFFGSGEEVIPQLGLVLMYIHKTSEYIETFKRLRYSL